MRNSVIASRIDFLLSSPKLSAEALPFRSHRCSNCHGTAIWVHGDNQVMLAARLAKTLPDSELLFAEAIARPPYISCILAKEFLERHCDETSNPCYGSIMAVYYKITMLAHTAVFLRSNHLFEQESTGGIFKLSDIKPLREGYSRKYFIVKDGEHENERR